MNEDLELTFVVTAAEGGLILNALAQMPYSQSAKIIEKLQAQGRTQVEAAQKEAKASN